jgi:hypothetical protein
MLPDGTEVTLTLEWEKLLEMLLDFIAGSTMAKDDLAKGEGFTDWAEFERDNKFSKNFINGTQSRHFIML